MAISAWNLLKWRNAEIFKNDVGPISTRLQWIAHSVNEITDELGPEE